MKFKSSDLVRVAICAGLTAALAWVTIPLPFTLVPISGQTISVMLSGLVLSPPLAALSQIVYILLGLLGLPVFSGGSTGLGTLLGPTGGYIWGFVLGAYVISTLLRRTKPKTAWGYGTVLLIGAVGVIYVAGVAQLMVVAELSLNQAIMNGMLPFLAGDLLKVLLGASLGRRFRHLRMD